MNIYFYVTTSEEYNAMSFVLHILAYRFRMTTPKKCLFIELHHADNAY